MIEKKLHKHGVIASSVYEKDWALTSLSRNDFYESLNQTRKEVVDTTVDLYEVAADKDEVQP